MKRILLLALPFLFAASSQAEEHPNVLDYSGQPPGLVGHPNPPPAARIQPGRLAFTPAEIDALVYPGKGRVLRLPSLERFTGNDDAGLEFQPMRLFAPGPRVVEVSDNGELELDRGSRQFYIATNATTGLGFSVDPVSGEFSGFFNKGGQRMQVRGNVLGQVEFTAVDEAEPGASSCATDLGDHQIDPAQDYSTAAIMSSSAAEAGEIISYEAVIAVETDNEWMDHF